MKKIKFIYVLIIFFNSTALFADYFSGGSISYQSLGNNQYLVTAKIVRDCAGNAAPPNLNLLVSSASCNSSMSFSMNVSGNNPLGTICPGAPTTCNGGTSPGFQEYSYTAVTTLPTNCPDWIFSISGCCRVNNFTSMTGQQNFYLEAALNNIGHDNNSMQNSNVDLITACIGQTTNFNLGSIDVEGDSLVYSLIDAQISNNGNVIYNPGYSGTNPVTSSPALSLNPVTGDIQMNMTTMEYSVIAIRIDEYRNGNLIGYTTHNVAVYSIVCSNNLPMMICPLQMIPIEATEQFCYDFICSDQDVDDTLTMTYNTSQIPGAVFTVTGIPIPTGHFCWTPTVNDTSSVPYTFTVSVRDQGCPSNGIVSCGVNLLVGPYTGLNKISSNNKIKISPNPVNDFFKIESTNLRMRNVFIYDLIGNSRQYEMQDDYNVSLLPAGIYFVKVQMENGEMRIAKMIKN